MFLFSAWAPNVALPIWMLALGGKLLAMENLPGISLRRAPTLSMYSINAKNETPNSQPLPAFYSLYSSRSHSFASALYLLELVVVNYSVVQEFDWTLDL